MIVRKSIPSSLNLPHLPPLLNGDLQKEGETNLPSPLSKRGRKRNKRKEKKDMKNGRNREKSKEFILFLIHLYNSVSLFLISKSEIFSKNRQVLHMYVNPQ